MRSLIVLCSMAAVVAGCSQPAASNNPPALSERGQIAAAALRHVMDSSGRAEQFSTYIVSGGECTRELIEAFADYTPKVVAGAVVVDRNGRLYDAATDRRVQYWSVKVTEIQADKATAEVSCAAGHLDAAWYVVQLRKEDRRWIVTSCVLEAVS